MIFCKYKFHIGKIADFFEPPEIVFGQIQSAESHTQRFCLGSNV